MRKLIQKMCDRQDRQFAEQAKVNAEQAKLIAGLLDRMSGQAPESPPSARPASAPVRPSTYSAAVGAGPSAAPSRANQTAPAAAAAGLSSASEEDKARQHALDHAKGWSSDRGFALAEACAHSVRRGASSASVKLRLRYGYCLFDECKKSDCQRCAAGRFGRKCVAHVNPPAGVQTVAPAGPRSAAN